MQKNLQFTYEEAQKFGITPAILLQNIRFWLTNNLMKKHNIRDGRVWMYCSVRQLREQFPYITTRQIRYALEKLLEAEILIKNNFNRTRYDRTLWYSINSDDYLANNAQTLCFSHLPLMSNGCAKNGNPIPDKKHILNQPTNLLLTTDQKIENEKVEKINKLTLSDLIDRLKANLKRSCVPMQYIKERASYFYERYKHIHVTSIAQLICKDWKKTHPNKPKKVNKARKVKDGSVSNLVKNLVQIDTSAWLEGILNQVKMDETEKVIAQAKFEEYTRFGQRPTFSGALQYVERGLEFSRRTECRAQMISDTLDQNAKKRVQEWERRTYKTTFEKLTDTSWAQNNWLDTFKTETC